MNWDNNSIVIYSNFPFHVEDWAPPSVKNGIGGSQEAIIYLSEELFKLGYQVTVFNRCGGMEGEYNGVVYQSIDKFNFQDSFNALIFHRAWTQPMMMKVMSKKLLFGCTITLNYFLQ
ncbi:hypothetical protein [Nostoc sp.]|uniref:hypothetical protein n=1 Tax=Nostoc sp. TaxID=1180 RepID=UPI002FF7BE78